MGLLTFVGRLVLVVANIIFLLASGVLVVFGFVLRFAHETVRPYVKDVLEEIETKVQKLGYNADFNTERFELGTSVSTVALVFILVGLGLLTFSVIGCCGACYAYKIFMLVYAVIIIVAVLAQVLAVILVYGVPGVIKDHVEPLMKTSLDEYQGLNGTTVVSLSWNWAMVEYHCCGVKGSDDFSNRTMWTMKNVLVTPEACCKQLPDNAMERQQCAGDKATATYNTTADIATNSNYDKGCLDTIWTKVIDNNLRYFLTVVIFCIAVQVVLIIFAILVFKDKGVEGVKSLLI